MVIVGDGYTADEQGDFEADARAGWTQLSQVEPYRSYLGMMNVWMVHAVSQDSGVSRDSDTYPGQVQDKATALGSYFWCAQTERLLCVDTNAVKSYAQTVVVANSTWYGGAGYYRGEGGELPEDYDLAGISHYYQAWGEPQAINLTTFGPGNGHGEAYLCANKYKWFRWLGEPDPTGSTVGMYDGGGYFASSIWGPTETSIMKSLGSTDFNLPSREAMIAGFYDYGDALTSTAPSGSVIRRNQVLTVDVAELTGLAYPSKVTGRVDGREVVRARGRTSVRPSELGVLPATGRHQLSATITDKTASIRDPEIHQATRTTLIWTVIN